MYYSLFRGYIGFLRPIYLHTSDEFHVVFGDISRFDTPTLFLSAVLNSCAHSEFDFSIDSVDMAQTIIFEPQVRLVADKVSKTPRGYAFIEYQHTRDMKSMTDSF